LPPPALRFSDLCFGKSIYTGQLPLSTSIKVYASRYSTIFFFNPFPIPSARPFDLVMRHRPLSIETYLEMVEKADLRHINNDLLIMGPDILLQSDCRTFDTMMFRLELREEALKTKLAVKTTAVEPSQSDPCSILVLFGGWAEQLVPPLPINVEKSWVRISRKQSYIEVCPPVYFILQNNNTKKRFWYLRGYRRTRAVICQIHSAKSYQRMAHYSSICLSWVATWSSPKTRTD